MESGIDDLLKFLKGRSPSPPPKNFTPPHSRSIGSHPKTNLKSEYIPKLSPATFSMLNMKHYGQHVEKVLTPSWNLSSLGSFFIQTRPILRVLVLRHCTQCICMLVISLNILARNRRNLLLITLLTFQRYFKKHCRLFFV